MPNQQNTSQFGAGNLYIIPNTGNPQPNLTPFKIGTIQDHSVDFKSENVKLFGQNRGPDLIAPSEIDLSIKLTFAAMQGLVLSQMFLSGTVAAGVVQPVDEEPHIVPAATPWTVTATNSAMFVQNFGVKYAATGRSLLAVTASPTQGQYTVSAGVYTFAAADEGVAVTISYSYTLAGTGQTFSYFNQKQGVGPSCQIEIFEPWAGISPNPVRGLYFANCFCKSLNFTAKQKGWEMYAAEFDVADNPGAAMLTYADLS